MIATAELTTPETSELMPELHFVYCRHTPDNIPAISEALAGCDAVLMECIGSDDELLETNFVLLNDITFGEVTYEDAVDFMRENVEGQNLNHYLDLFLALELYGTNKYLLPIDIARDNPAYDRLDALEAREWEFWRSFSKGSVPVHLARGVLSSLIREKAAVNTMREQTVAAQLATYATRLAIEHGVEKIGVVQGAVHTNSSHEMTSKGFNVTRQFIDREEEEKGLKIQFGPYETACRFKRFNPDEQLPEALLDKILVENIMLTRLAVPPRDGRHEAEWSDTLNALRSVVLDRMPEDELQSFLSLWEHNHHRSAKGRKRRTARLIFEVINAYNPVETELIEAE